MASGGAWAPGRARSFIKVLWAGVLLLFLLFALGVLGCRFQLLPSQVCGLQQLELSTPKLAEQPQTSHPTEQKLEVVVTKEEWSVNVDIPAIVDRIVTNKLSNICEGGYLYHDPALNSLVCKNIDIESLVSYEYPIHSIRVGDQLYDISYLVDVYTAGTGLKKTGNTFSVNAPVCEDKYALAWDPLLGFKCVKTGEEYTVTGTFLTMSGTTIAFKEGALTDDNVCKYIDGVGLECNTDTSLWDTDVTDDVRYLTDLQDVSAPTVTLGDVLRFDGTEWTAHSIKFTDLFDTPSTYGTAGHLLQTDGTGGIIYVDPLSLDVGYWARSGTTISPRYPGDDVVLNAGETLTITDFTPGGIVFAEAGGLLSQDPASLFWDNVNKRLGIGTNNPQAEFHLENGIMWLQGDFFMGGPTPPPPVPDSAPTRPTFMWYPSMMAIRMGVSTFPDEWSEAWMGYGSVAIGAGNIVSGDLSFAFGEGHQIDGYASVALGGGTNQVDAFSSGVFAGERNIVDFGANYSVLLGGVQNRAGGLFTSWLGGWFNSAEGYASVGIGGAQNTITTGGGRGAIIGGTTNTLSGYSSVILGGASINLGGAWGVAGGSYIDVAGGDHIFVFGSRVRVAGAPRGLFVFDYDTLVPSTQVSVGRAFLVGPHTKSIRMGIGVLAPSAYLHVAPKTKDAIRIEPYSTTAGSTSELQFRELVANGAEYVGFKAPDSIATSTVWTLPEADGGAGFLLSTNGARRLGWTDPSTLSYWARSGTTLSPRNAGDDIVLNTGEALTISDFTPGGLVYATTGGRLTQDAASLYWDETTQSLGLGTSTPTARLHIYDAGTGGELLKVESQYSSVNNFLTGWTYRKPVTINNPSATDLIDYQVRLAIDTAALIAAGKMNTDCSDLRFTLGDGLTILPYWIETGCNTAQTVVWIKVPTLTKLSDTQLYMYYGNTAATSASDGSQVFDFFDDFTAATLDPAVWTVISTSAQPVAGVLRLSPLSQTRHMVVTTDLGFTSNVVVETKMRYTVAGSEENMLLVLANPAGAALEYALRGRTNDDTFLEPRTVVADGTSTAGTPILSTGTNYLQNVWYYAKCEVSSSGAVSCGFSEYNAGYTGFTVTHSNVDPASNWGTTWTSQLGGGVGIAAFGSLGGESEFDWIRVRKYASAEPVVAFGTEETSTAAPGPLQVNFVIRDGMVGIHTNAPNYPLQVGDPGDGTIAISNAWVTFSDKRFKEDVTQLQGSLDRILQLRGVEYRWKQSGKQDVGFIAQEVQAVLPTVVVQDTNGYLGVDYTKIIPYLVEAVKELDAKIINQAGGIGVESDLTLSTLTATQVNTQIVKSSAVDTVTLDVSGLSVDSNGNLVTSGSIVADSLTVNDLTTNNATISQANITELTVQKLSVGPERSGEAVIPAGQSSVIINVKGMTASTKVYITLLEGDFVTYRVIRAEGQFTIETKTAVSKDTHFSWLVLD